MSEDFVNRESQDWVLRTAFLLTDMIGNTKKDYIGFFTSNNEICRDLFIWTRSFGSICVLTLNIFQISIIMRENITLGLKFHSPFLCTPWVLESP